MSEPWGLSELGFIRPEYDDILQDYEVKAVEIFGADINLSSRSPLGVFVRVFAWVASTLWMLVEKVYLAGYVDTASGASLFRIGKLVGITRISAMKATGESTFNGEAGTIIPAGFLVRTESNVRFLVQQRGTIPATGSITLPIVAEEVGSDGNVSAGSIVVAVTPIAGLASLQNNHDTVGGRLAETDEEFRDRYQSATSTGRSSSTDAIRADILKLPGVSSTKVFENENDTVTAGLPPHSIHAIVQGGSEEAIALCIHKRKSAGIQTHGTSSANIVDASGTERTIRFSRPTVLLVWVKVSGLVTSLSEGALPDVQAEIRDALIRYIGGTDSTGKVAQGMSIGESLMFNRLYTIINGVDGVENYQLTVSTNGSSYTSGDIGVAQTQVVTTALDKVVFAP